MMAMLVHAIYLKASPGDYAALGSGYTNAHICNRDMGGPAGVHELGCFAQKIYEVSNPAASELVLQEVPRETMIYFDPPLLWPWPDVWIGVWGAGNVNAKDAAGYLLYTLEKVAKEDFIAALVE